MKWRTMTLADIPGVKAIADSVHVDYPEEEAIFTERMLLFPAGCSVLVAGKRLLGYCVAHPWRFGSAPALNRLLGALPKDADTLYIHDVALIPQARGQNAVQPRLTQLINLASRIGFDRLSLTAVSNSVGFWQKHGFSLLEDTRERGTLASYGAEARAMVRFVRE